MRMILLIVMFICLLSAMHAQAGNMNISDGRVNWQSTKCSPPKEPFVLSHDPETAANDLNTMIAQHNQYADESQAYMDCVSKEAQADAEASNQGIINSAQNIIQQTQEKVEASSSRLSNRPPAAVNQK